MVYSQSLEPESYSNNINVLRLSCSIWYFDTLDISITIINFRILSIIDFDVCLLNIKLYTLDRIT